MSNILFLIINRFKWHSWISALIVIGICAPFPISAQKLADGAFDKTVSQGEAAFARGWLEEAIHHWTEALNIAINLGVPADQVDVLARRAEAYQILGYIDKSKADLETAIELVMAQGLDNAIARRRGNLTNVDTLAGAARAARAELDTALAHAAAAGDKLFEAPILHKSDLESAIDLVKTRGFEETAVRLRGSLADIDTLAGKAKAARAELDAVLVRAAIAGDKLLKARVLDKAELETAIDLVKTQGLADTVVRLRGNLADVDPLGDKAKAARAELGVVLAHASAASDKLLEAHTFNKSELESAIDAVKTQGSDDMAGRLRGNLADVDTFAGKAKAARAEMDAAFADAAAASDKLLETRILNKADLETAIDLVKARGADDTMARLRGSLASVYTLAGEAKAARAELDTVLAYAAAAGDKLLEARTLNNLGNLMFEQKQYSEAAGLYRRSGTLAGSNGHNGLQWAVTINAAYAMSADGHAERAEIILGEALQGLGALSQNSATANGLISIGRLLLKLQTEARQSRPDLSVLTYRALDQAGRIAAVIGDERAESYAIGYMAQLYEREGRSTEALQLTRQALFRAQRLNAPEALYLWQWQIGRIKWAEGDLEEAVAAYRAAVGTLRSISADIVAGLGGGRSSFQDSVRPVIVGLADLLLRSSNAMRNDTERQALLADARGTVELLKAAELEDYFQDSCVAALQAKEKAIDQVAAHTAVLYPIMLPDRLELLLSLPSGLSRVTVPIPEDTLKPVAENFRLLLAKRTTWQYLAPARKLYSWLITPIEARLAENEVSTLVVIPSGSLSTFPFAALHDGKRYLIEKMAVAVAPGLSLIEPRPIERKTATVLAAGLSNPVQGFPALPYVQTELRNLLTTFGGTRLENEAFLVDAVEQALEVTPYTIIHVASHAQIEPETKDSFLLTYDGRFTMDRLERFVKLSRFREEPVELLTLSACSTAVGDERAALGLAGIGIKAGARSVLASLWFIYDQSTSLLVSRFYEALNEPNKSKAEALREAQLSLMATYRYRHPAHWAPFLLIGSWL